MCLAACTTAQNAEQAGDGTKQQTKKPVVYFTRDLSAEGLKKVYHARPFRRRVKKGVQ